ncbi:hypothetical protein ABZS88_37055 [Streptomyces sp. NPDC005480]|uniref:hypothetical protein n=1 Tax=Streptomyces sp. NPDC005480 TaxID=3154880 RepID=UPI0033B0E7D4
MPPRPRLPSSRADPVLAATLGHDERTGVSPRHLPGPEGLAKSTAAKQTALDWITANESTITALGDDVWQHAELSLREGKSSRAHARLLQDNGSIVKWGSADLPTAFVAAYGTEGPVIGFNAEYDALPGLSQKKGVGSHDPLVYNYDAYGPTYGAGHGDAHNCLGAGGTAAAIAVARAIMTNGLKATVKLFGSAVISATFTFLGASGHGGTPLGNKSGLDGALLMATMSEYLREKNVAPSGRFHYAIINGGGAPNVTPDMCSIWFFVREGSRRVPKWFTTRSWSAARRPRRPARPAWCTSSTPRRGTCWRTRPGPNC